jgi:hypothetical protein
MRANHLCVKFVCCSALSLLKKLLIRFCLKVTIVMNPLIKKRALEIMNNLMNHPCSSVFCDVQLPKIRKNDTGERTTLSNLSLSIIKQRLNENKYARVQQWFDDIEQLWTEIEIRPGIDQIVLDLVAESRKFFIKERRGIDMLSSHNWPDELGRIKTRISVLMSLPPPRIKHEAMKLSNSLIPKPDVPVIDEGELHAFVAASEMMESDEENAEINRILTEMQPETNIPENSSARIDVSQLSVQTIQALKTYMKARLEERGLQYPSVN